MCNFAELVVREMEREQVGRLQRRGRTELVCSPWRWGVAT